MWDAFLLRMDDFDRVFDQFLELNLRHVLDPIVATEPPRRTRSASQRTLVVAGPADLGPEAMKGTEPVALTVPVSVTQV